MSGKFKVDSDIEGSKKTKVAKQTRRNQRHALAKKQAK